MLVDYIGGLVNHHRRGPGEWTVSSELSLELAPDALAQLAAAPDGPVIGTGRPCGRKGPNALGLCEFTHRDAVVATATVRSFYIQAPAISRSFLTARQARCLPVRWPTGWRFGSPRAAARRRSSCRTQNNSLGIVHGGVSAMALELVGSAAVNDGREDQPLNTASLRVNFLRQFHSGPESRYEGTALRVGRAAAASRRHARSTMTASRRSSPASPPTAETGDGLGRTDAWKSTRVR
jgi:hypothetical protein